jgi:nondiscriminating aspartyl-tRNA synthetase
LQNITVKDKIVFMERTLISQTPKKIGQKVKLCGWVNTRRDHGQMVFIDLRDRSGIVQIVGDKKLGQCRPEYVIEILGLVKKRPSKMVNKKITTGEVEIEVEKLKVLTKSEELPFDTGREELKVQLPTLLDFRPLTLRQPTQKAIFRTQEKITQAFREYLVKEGFIEIFCPTITATATEGGAELFKVNYFDYDAFLTQSPQFYKQIAVGAFERVFTIAHAYRAEPSMTTRHLTEYIGLDVEMGFIDSWEDVYQTADKLLRFIFAELKEIKPEIDALRGKGKEMFIPEIAEKTPVLKLREAQEKILGKSNCQEPDLSPEDEKKICEWAKKEKGSDLVIITHYPTQKRPMYTFPDPQKPEYTLSFDILGQGVEWVTGSQRINDYQQLSDNIKKWGGHPRDFAFYLQAFKYGMPPEGGFCLGLERITQNILGLANVRQASLFPRDLERVDVRLSTIQKKNVKK